MDVIKVLILSNIIKRTCLSEINLSNSCFIVVIPLYSSVEMNTLAVIQCILLACISMLLTYTELIQQQPANYSYVGISWVNYCEGMTKPYSCNLCS